MVSGDERDGLRSAEERGLRGGGRLSQSALPWKDTTDPGLETVHACFRRLWRLRSRFRHQQAPRLGRTCLLVEMAEFSQAVRTRELSGASLNKSTHPIPGGCTLMISPLPKAPPPPCHHFGHQGFGTWVWGTQAIYGTRRKIKPDTGRQTLRTPRFQAHGPFRVCASLATFCTPSLSQIRTSGLSSSFPALLIPPNPEQRKSQRRQRTWLEHRSWRRGLLGISSGGGGGVSLEIWGGHSLQSTVTLGDIPSTASSREKEGSVKLVHEREAAKAALMERSPRVTAHGKAGTGLQARTTLSSRRRGEGDAVLTEKSADATVGRQHS